MGQITFELDDQLEQQLHQFLAQQHLSKNNWLKEIIQQRLNNGWSNEVKVLAGSWADFSSAEHLRVSLGNDTGREEL